MTRISHSLGYPHSPEGNRDRDRCWRTVVTFGPWFETLNEGVCNLPATSDVGLCRRCLQELRRQEAA